MLKDDIYTILDRCLFTVCLGEKRFSDGIMYRDCTTDSIKLSPYAFISVVYFAVTFNMPTSYQ